jgi:hypothetical protein
VAYVGFEAGVHGGNVSLAKMPKGGTSTREMDLVVNSSSLEKRTFWIVG